RRLLDGELPVGSKQLEQVVPAPVSAHRRALISLATSCVIAFRPAAPYPRGSTARSSAASASLSAPVNTLLSCVPMLIFVSPACTAAASVPSGTPEDPCSTSGTGTAALICLISSRSSTASLVSIACELPTATASASTPVAAT